MAVVVFVCGRRVVAGAQMTSSAVVARDSKEHVKASEKRKKEMDYQQPL
jgi:hypothetical protein